MDGWMGSLTCNLPASSRSPRSFTNTVSLSDSRTRSRGSLTGLSPFSGESAIVGSESGGVSE